MPWGAGLVSRTAAGALGDHQSLGFGGGLSSQVEGEGAGQERSPRGKGGRVAYSHCMRDNEGQFHKKTSVTVTWSSYTSM